MKSKDEYRKDLEWAFLNGFRLAARALTELARFLVLVAIMALVLMICLLDWAYEWVGGEDEIHHDEDQAPHGMRNEHADYLP